MPIRWRALPGALLLVGATFVGTAAHARAQSDATVVVEENFRREPNGVVLARLGPGTPVRVLETEGSWTRVELEGWVWLRSLQASEDPGFELVVSAAGGENLRDSPSGSILGRLEEGALLTELDRDPAWARVSRTGWIWSPSLDTSGFDERASPGGEEAPPVAPGAGDPSARSPGGFARIGGAGASILTAPDGDTLARARPSTDVQLLRREGNWARVRLEGWVWMPTVTDEQSEPAQEGAVLEPADLGMDPEGYAGRVVSWTLQYISLERAEAVRTDFFEGEPFLLARYGGPDGPFVYVAVPTDRLPEVEGLLPLERISVTGRVRTGASSLTGAPILDLIEVERSREDP